MDRLDKLIYKDGDQTRALHGEIIYEGNDCVRIKTLKQVIEIARPLVLRIHRKV